MDAWPMVARCKISQWRGLEPWEQRLSKAAWDAGFFPLDASMYMLPIWTVEYDEWRRVELIAMKLG